MIEDNSLRDKISKQSTLLASTTFNIDTINKEIGEIYKELCK